MPAAAQGKAPALASPCVAKTATFDVTTTTPLDLVTDIPFKLSFTCP